MSDTITITGTIGTELDHKRMPNGLVITSFRLVSNQRYRDRETNTWVEGEASWYSVSVFRVLAENTFASLHKGERVIVAGRLRVREWETSAKKGVTAEIEADSIGHDLLFGTTRFTKNRGNSSGSADVQAPEAAAPREWSMPISDGDAVSWANPGVAADGPLAAKLVDASAHDEAGEGETYAVAELALANGDTPF